MSDGRGWLASVASKLTHSLFRTTACSWQGVTCTRTSNFRLHVLGCNFTYPLLSPPLPSSPPSALLFPPLPSSSLSSPPLPPLPSSSLLSPPLPSSLHLNPPLQFFTFTEKFQQFISSHLFVLNTHPSFEDVIQLALNEDGDIYKQAVETARNIDKLWLTLK